MKKDIYARKVFDTRPTIPLVLREREATETTRLVIQARKLFRIIEINLASFRCIRARRKTRWPTAGRVSRGFSRHALKSSTLYKDTN